MGPPHFQCLYPPISFCVRDEERPRHNIGGTNRKSQFSFEDFSHYSPADPHLKNPDFMTPIGAALLWAAATLLLAACPSDAADSQPAIIAAGSELQIVRNGFEQFWGREAGKSMSA